MKKNIFLFLFAGLMAFTFSAQAQKTSKSPAAKTQGTVGSATITIDYSQPSARERKVMGGLVPYGQVWRTGANNATVFTVDQNVKIEGQTLPAGKYALFTIPGQDEWVIIFNKKYDQWGAFNYNEEDDALRVSVQPEQSAQFVEAFTIGVDGGVVNLAWENTNVKFRVTE